MALYRFSYRRRQRVVAGTVFPHAIDSSIPLAMGPHAVLRAVSVACASSTPDADAQLLRPRKSMHTSHVTLALLDVMMKKRAAIPAITAMVYSVERFIA